MLQFGILITSINVKSAFEFLEALHILIILHGISHYDVICQSTLSGTSTPKGQNTLKITAFIKSEIISQFPHIALLVLTLDLV